MFKRVTKRHLVDVIAEAMREELKAYEIEGECERLGLPPADGDDPMSSKAWYVRRHLISLPLQQIVAIGHDIVDNYAREDVAEALAGFGATSVQGEMKQLIFAADGPRPRLVLRCAVNNVVDIVEHAEYCLVYDRPLTPELLT